MDICRTNGESVASLSKLLRRDLRSEASRNEVDSSSALPPPLPRPESGGRQDDSEPRLLSSGTDTTRFGRDGAFASSCDTATGTAMVTGRAGDCTGLRVGLLPSRDDGFEASLPLALPVAASSPSDDPRGWRRKLVARRFRKESLMLRPLPPSGLVESALVRREAPSPGPADGPAVGIWIGADEALGPFPAASCPSRSWPESPILTS